MTAPTDVRTDWDDITDRLDAYVERLSKGEFSGDPHFKIGVLRAVIYSLAKNDRAHFEQVVKP